LTTFQRRNTLAAVWRFGLSPVISPPELPDSVLRLFIAAQRIAEQTPDFFKTKGPGVGDHASLALMAALQKISQDIFGAK
jgi:hypothetical protein